MNVLRNQWSVSAQTVAVVQLSGSDALNEVFLQVDRDTSRVRSTRQHRCLVEDASAYWRPVELLYVNSELQ